MRFDIWDAMDFYHFSMRVLSFCNAMGTSEGTWERLIASCIHDIDNQLYEQGFVCEEPLFPFSFYLFCSRVYPESLEMCKMKVKRAMKNVYVPFLSYKQKIDYALLAFRMYATDVDLDDRKRALSALKTIVDSDMAVFEQKLMKNIYKNRRLNLGLEFGLCRLLVFTLNWDTIQKGIFPDSLVRLLV